MYLLLPLRQPTTPALTKRQTNLTWKSVIYFINSHRFFSYMHKGDSATGATSTSSWTFKSSSLSKLRNRSLKVGEGDSSYEVARQLTNVLAPSMHSHYIYPLAYRTRFVFIFTAFPREILLSLFIIFNIQLHDHPFISKVLNFVIIFSSKFTLRQ